jgi:hypothetical protein
MVVPDQVALIRDVLAVVAAACLASGILLRTVDPRGEFGTGLFPIVVRDSRAEKMRLFSARRESHPVQGLILGSSRSMKLRPDVFREKTGLEFFNFAVENARAEDYLAIARWVRQQHVRPAMLVVGLDIEALHNDDVAEEQLQANQELELALTGHRDPWQRLWTYKRAFTPTYFLDSLESVWRLTDPGKRPAYLLEPDGHLRNPDIDARRAEGTFDFVRDSPACFDIYVARFQGMTALSPTRQHDLVQLIEEERTAGGRTTVWLTPLHPSTEERLEARTAYARLHRDTRAYLGALGAESDVATFDFSNPRLYGGTQTGWDDCAHTDQADADRIAAALVVR